MFSYQNFNTVFHILPYELYSQASFICLDFVILI